MNIESRKNFIINFIYSIIVGLIIYVIFKYGIFWFMPFVIGFLVAFILKPVINGLSKISRLNRKFVAALVIFIFYGTVGMVIGLLIFKLFLSAQELFYLFPHIYYTNFEPAIKIILTNIESTILKLDPNVVGTLQNMVIDLTQSLGTLITGLSSRVVGFISGLASSVPVMLITIAFTIISTFFIAMDYYKISEFIINQFPEKGRLIIVEIKEYIVGTIFKFIKAYAIIITITFIELAIGLSILKVDKATSVAALIAMVDVLPILGTGGVVIPWVIVSFVLGDTSFAVGLVILYLTITIVRNILEPKIVGDQIGLHPLLMLISMFIGARLFGILGLLILPFMMIIAKNLNDAGKIKLFK